MRLHIKDTNGTMWFELTRKKSHLFYMQMDFVDVMPTPATHASSHRRREKW